MAFHTVNPHKIESPLITLYIIVKCDFFLHLKTEFQTKSLEGCSKKG